MRVQAAVLREAPGALTVAPVEVDDTLEPGEVRVEVKACGLCHSDLHMIDGTFPTPLPTVPGHEVAGVVTEIGSAVDNVQVGDHVVACLSIFCGFCEECRAGRSWLCVHRMALTRAPRSRPRQSSDGAPVNQVAGLGGLAETTIVAARSLVAIDERVPLDLAAVLGCAVLTGVGSAITGAGVGAGDSVVVIGCGGVGLNVIQGARIAGASRIVAVDRSAEALQLARELGATDCIGDAADPLAGILETLGGPADHTFDVVASPATTLLAVRAVRPGRTAWLVGIPAGQAALELPGVELLTQAKGLQGLLMGSNRFDHDIPQLVDHYLAGRLDLDSLVTRRLPLSEVQQGYDQMRGGGSGRTVITFE